MDERHFFFAYPAKPDLLRETVGRGATLIQESTGFEVLPWERLQIGGRTVISQVLEAIDASQLAVFEVTDLNLNVLFELGYAIARGKRIWLLRDSSIAESERAWKHMNLLMPIGYSAYQSSDGIRKQFLSQRPDLAESTLYDSAIEQNLVLDGPPTVLHARSPHSDEADRVVTRRVSRVTADGIRRVTIDPGESPVEPLTWYAQHVAAASAVIVHFASPRRRDSELFNSRYAFVAGLASGFETPTLLLGESDLLAPFDYQDRIYRYASVRKLDDYVDAWLTRELAPAFEEVAQGRDVLRKRSRVHALKSLDLGEHLAENEEPDLPGYFIETAAYRSVLRSTTTVFEGRKGTGKTANLLRAAAELREDKRNLVCVLQPVSYEMEGVLSLLKEVEGQARGGYILESLWKYIVYTQIASSAADYVRRRPEYVRIDGSPERAFLSYIEGPGRMFDQDFSLRLESVLEGLREAAGEKRIADQRVAVAEALHSGPLTELRRLLGALLARDQRVFVLVDNLDKAWQRDAQLDDLARFLLGLIEAAPAIARDFGKDVGWRAPVPVTMAIFIRSDILSRVRAVASESDKMPVAPLQWTRELLRSVVEERYQATQEREVAPDEFWEKFFCPLVGDTPTSEYICDRVLLRPRDILYYCKAAIAAAVNRRHERVELVDLRTADDTYSQFAFEALAIEAASLSAGTQDFESLFFEFAGVAHRHTEAAVIDAIRRAGIDGDGQSGALDLLRELGVLGVEVRSDEFDFSETAEGRRRADALSSAYVARSRLPKRFAVRSAYAPYLGTEGDQLSEKLREATDAGGGHTLF